MIAMAILVWSTAIDAAPASEVPEGGEYIMSDWILFSFIAFFGSALVAFLVAVRRGAFRDLERAKYHLLTVDEPDYYTPEWAKDDGSNDLRK